MESRGLGREGERTFYRTMKMDRADWSFLVISLLLYAALVAALVRFDLFRFSFASIQ